ncbi:NTPase [Pseudomonas phage ER16]|nr:NTPase [Pseudomonas phage ER16]
MLLRSLRAAHRSKAHLNVGERRQHVLGLLSTMDGLALQVKFGRGIGQADTKGNVFMKEVAPEEESAEAATFSRIAKGVTIDPRLSMEDPMAVMGAAYGNKKIGNLIIPCGVCLIVGPGGSGKTPLAHTLASYGVHDYGIVRIGEPLAGYSGSEKATAENIARGIVLESDLVIDSIKDLLASGGSLMKGGISRDALITLSEWSAIACDMGTTLYIPVNPSSAEPEMLALLGEAARSNATSTILHAGDSRWEYIGRTGEGLTRTKASITFRDDQLTIEGRSVVSVPDREAAQAVVAKIDNYRGAISRAIRSTDNSNDDN